MKIKIMLLNLPAKILRKLVTIPIGKPCEECECPCAGGYSTECGSDEWCNLWGDDDHGACYLAGRANLLLAWQKWIDDMDARDKAKMAKFFIEREQGERKAREICRRVFDENCNTYRQKHCKHSATREFCIVCASNYKDQFLPAKNLHDYCNSCIHFERKTAPKHACYGDCIFKKKRTAGSKLACKYYKEVLL